MSSHINGVRIYLKKNIRDANYTSNLGTQLEVDLSREALRLGAFD